jgi:hypothetical protein
MSMPVGSQSVQRFPGVVGVDAEIPHGRRNRGMSKQQLHGA